MSGVRDPAFWKRFSTAVHLDEEQAPSTTSSDSSVKRPKLKQQDSWIAREKKKRSRRSWVLWGFWLSLIGFTAAIIGVVIWLIDSGMMHKLGQKIEEATSNI